MHMPLVADAVVVVIVAAVVQSLYSFTLRLTGTNACFNYLRHKLKISVYSICLAASTLAAAAHFSRDICCDSGGKKHGTGT